MNRLLNMNPLYSFYKKCRSKELCALVCFAVMGPIFVVSCDLPLVSDTDESKNRNLYSRETVRIVDQQVQDVQLINDETFILLGDFTSIGNDCYLQILRGDTAQPLRLNHKLTRYGQPVAISNVIDGRIIIAAAKIEEDEAAHSLKLLLVNLEDEEIIDSMELENIADEPVLNEDGLVLEYDSIEDQKSGWLPADFLRNGKLLRLMLNDDGKIFVTVRDQSAKLFLIDFAKKESTTATFGRLDHRGLAS